MTALALAEPAVAGDRLELLALDEITPATDNPRRDVGDLAELAASIRTVGLLEPLVVTPRDGGYLLVCGARRHAAAKQAGLDVVPALVRDFDETTRQEAMLIENLQRTDLTVLEEANAYARLVELGHSQRKLAERVGRSQAHVSKRLALLELPDQVRARVDSGGITVGDALELTKLAAHPERLLKASRPGAYDQIPRLVERELQEVKLDEQVAKARQQAAKKGWTVVEHARDPAYWFTPPKGTFKIGSGNGAADWDALPLDAKAHEKEPCHAVGIERRTGELIPLCTDRKRHPKVKTRGEKDNAIVARAGVREDPARVKARQELDAAAERRQAFTRELLAKKTLPKTGIADVLVGALIEIATLNEEDLEYACQALGLATKEELSSDPAFDPLSIEELYRRAREHASKNESNALRVGLAIALSIAEGHDFGSWSMTAWGDGARGILTFLESNGYEISAVERQKVATL